MKTIPLLLLSLLHCTLLHAQPNQKPKPNDFIFELTHINQPDADIYVISQDNVKKFSEWQNPPVTYWGPSKNGVDGSLTYKFPLNQPTEKIHLVANLASFNFAFGRGSGTGQSSLWASKDGKNWTMLLDNPVPNRVDSYKTFDSDLPKELLGSNEIWIQIRLRTEGAPMGSYATAQFARSSANSIEPVFYISTRDKPPKRASEPADTQQPKPAQPAAQKFDLNDLIGDNLIDANGNPIDSATLKNKFIGIYFSAHWCGPCRQFTPKLVEFRNQIADQFEVVFASADQDAPAMLSYMKEAAMPWPALPFASPKISSLNRAFQIRSIPTFVVLDPTGRLASPNARNDVTTLSPKDALSKWKIDAEKAAPPKPALVPPPVLSSTSENPPKDTSIVPGKSLLGCPIGSTEEEVVKKLGKPMANFRLGENATALLYYNGTALLRFHNGKLLDGNFSGSSQLGINHFHEQEVPAYSLPNGIAIGTDLQELKDVLVNKVDSKNINESSNLSYLDEGLMIKLQYTKHTIHVNGNKTIQYKIDSIQIENPNSPFGFKSIDPGKSIFGCPLGASEAEIIKILGEPQGKIDLGQNKIGLLYDNFSNLLILWDGVLGGGAFQSGRIFQNDLYLGNNMVTLTNGVALKTSLAKAKEILGEKLDISKSMHEATYQAGDSLISLISYSRTPNGVSHEEAAKDINNYTIHSIQIDPISKAQPVSPSTGCAIPKKQPSPPARTPKHSIPLIWSLSRVEPSRKNQTFPASRWIPFSSANMRSQTQNGWQSRLLPK
jgi:nucleoredoxin